MAVLQNASTLVSSSSSSGVIVCTCAFPRRLAPDEATTASGACGGMGWATSTAPMQLQ
jgi:hypothetical protein